MENITEILSITVNKVLTLTLILFKSTFCFLIALTVHQVFCCQISKVVHMLVVIKLWRIAQPGIAIRK